VVGNLLQLLRYVVFAAVAFAALAAFAAMAVQKRAFNPFSRTARTIRDLTDPLLKPFERRVLRGGGNPQNAPWWLLGAAIVLGILLLTVVDWVVVQVVIASAAAGGGTRSLGVLLAQWAFNIVMLALLVRVIGSWIGIGRYNRWMRPFVILTEWMLAPLRRVLPPFGQLDVSPIVAWLLLSVVRTLVLNAL